MRPHRPEKVASVVREVISEAIARRLSDPRIAPLTTVTRVKMSRDLQVATVFISVVGTPAQERRTLRGLLHARGYLQRMVGRNLQLRNCPELRIDIDASAREVRETLRLIEGNRPPEDPVEAPEEGPGGADDPGDDVARHGDDARG